MRRKNMKILVAAMVFCMGISVSGTSYAMEAQNAASAAQFAGDEGIQPYWNNTITMSADLNISGSTATVRASVAAKEVNTIATEIYLQKKSGSSWTTVKSWLSWTTAPSYSRTESYALSSRGTYRVYATFKVGGELTSATSSSKTY